MFTNRIGAVFSHCMDDSSEKLIAFASCSLAHAEKKHTQLGKEGLAIVFRVRKFHHYPVRSQASHYSTCSLKPVLLDPAMA